MTPKRIPRPTLRVLRGPTPGQTFEIDRGVMMIGREPSCDVVLDSRSVSRRHARLERRAEGYFLRDLGSTGGTWVNGAPLEGTVQLRHGDRIELADCLLVFAARSPEPRTGEDEESTIIGLRDSSGTAEQLLVGVRPAEKLRAILEINRELVGSLDLDVVLGKVLDGLFRIFPHTERGFVLLGEAGAIELTPRAMKLLHDGPARPTLSRSILEHVMLQGKAILCEDLQGDPWLGGSNSVDDAGLRTLMCVPLRDHTRRPVGAIQLDTTNPLVRFTSEDLDLLVAVASQVAMAVDNARLYREAGEARRQAGREPGGWSTRSSPPPRSRSRSSIGTCATSASTRRWRRSTRCPSRSTWAGGSARCSARAAARFEHLIRNVIETGKPILGLEIVSEQPDSSGVRRCWLGYCYPALGEDRTVQGIGVILEDITEARRAETELRSSEERYRLLFESNPHPMWVYDKGRPCNSWP